MRRSLAGDTSVPSRNLIHGARTARSSDGGRHGRIPVQRATIAQGDDLSFINEGSGFEVPRTEDGNWFTRGALTVFEYRFRG
jgi:hypothetical protein